MGKTRIFKLAPDGTVSGLHSDFLAPLGRASIERASNVEFCEEIGRWFVEFLIGPFKGACLIETFARRSDALSAEVRVLNQQHANGLLASHADGAN